MTFQKSTNGGGGGHYRCGVPPRPHLFHLTLDDLAALVVEWGLPRFRAAQVMQWVYEHRIADPEAMTNLSKRDRATLAERLDFVTGQVVRHQVASDGTQKLLVDWTPPVSRRACPGDRAEEDAGTSPAANAPTLKVLDTPSDRANQTECVMIPSASQASGRVRRTACVSSQVGCPVGCRFCASGLGGLDGNLTAGQIVQQAWALGNVAPAPGFGDDYGGPVTNVVFMGMGEPLSNFEEVARAVRLMTAPWGLNLSARRITVSTVGLPAQIRRLAEIDLPITLAISLHAPNDAIRREIIPWAKFVTIEQLIDAGRYYFDRTGREVTLEYILLGNVNDGPEHAEELADVAGRLRANVNLIRYNEVAGLPFARPASEAVHPFQEVLRRRGINTHIRASRGRDISAACGQLRHESSHRPHSPAVPAHPV